MTRDLFEDVTEADATEQQLAPGAVLLRGFALPAETELLAGLEGVIARVPFRHMVTPGGFRMSVGMTNSGSLGWVTDRTGYRYDAVDPESGRQMASNAGLLPEAGAGRSGARRLQRIRAGWLSHQSLRAGCPALATVSLGIPAVFLFGGMKRADKPDRVELKHGDVVVWGGPARLRYHGVMPLKEGHHPLVGRHRINLTFRKAG